MPNHVRNVIRMEGIGKLPLYGTSEDGVRYFDFNKLIPMPEALNIAAGSPETDAICALIIRLCSGRFLPVEIKELKNRIACKAKSAEEEQELVEIGLQYATNVVKYRASTWYDWCIREWGTKWNAYECEIEDDQVKFSTAWSNPEPVIKKLAEMYPESHIEHLWADEDTGNNTGFRQYDDGVWTECYDDSCSNDAYERYIECWGESNCLYQDDDGNWRHRNCDDCDGCK